MDALSRRTTDPNRSNANASDAVDADRTYVSHVNNFVPSNNYRPVKGKGRPAQNRGQKRKLNAGKSKPCLKDVILLTAPTKKEVTRGWRREELYDKNSVENSEGMNESDIREKLNFTFHDKLLNIPEPKFSFVRAVGNKIINPGCESYNGKVVKHLSRQGPLYVRSTQDTAVGLDILKAQSADKSEDWDTDQEEKEEEILKLDSDDDTLLVSPFDVGASSNYQPSTSFTVAHSPVHGTNVNTSSPSYLPATRDTSPSNIESCVITAVMVTCPTCNSSFSSEEIAEHADLYAEAAEGGLQSGITYGNLVMQDMSISPIEMNSDTKESEVTLKGWLVNLQAQVRAE